MRNTSPIRFNRNKSAQDPAYLVEQAEPHRGYTGGGWVFQAPTPKASEFMRRCVDAAHAALNDWALNTKVRLKRKDAVQEMARIRRNLRDLNILLLREYLTNLRGLERQRALRTLAHLERLPT